MIRLLLLVFAGSLFTASLVLADPAPGDIYREFVWTPSGKAQQGKWQRITGPKATAERAKRKLPNPVNELVITDLAGVVRAEFQIELLQSHFGTAGQSFRFNAGEWLRIPPSTNIPGAAGAGEGGPHHWLSMRYPTVPVPLAELRSGKNTFEFTCEGEFGLGLRWPQSIVNGAILRVYYDGDKAPPPGRVEALPPTDPGVIGIDLTYLPAGHDAVARVDFIARHTGFDWRGEGQYSGWHYNYRRGELRHHLGTAGRGPWRIHWDTTWLPRNEPVAVMARVADGTGLYRLTPVLDPVELPPADHGRIELFAPYDVPPRWHTRAARRHACKIRLPEDLSQLKEARAYLATWNGEGADEIGVNGVVLARNIGRNHDLSYDVITVPVSILKPGENEFFTSSEDKEHGIEVQWPGFVLLARFQEPRHGAEEEGPE